ncbi:MAG: hypothetical protein MH825_07330 [Cyanobacteria bacterium]|nr:hypothetical protein [Cyanobacteriota bacterium]
MALPPEPMDPIRTAILVAALEGIVAVVALAIAPHWLNSDHPALGFAILVGVPMMLIGSVAYGLWRVVDAHRARHLLLALCPDQAHLSWVDFLTIPARRVRQRGADLRAIATDPAARELGLSPLDLLQPPRRRRRSPRPRPSSPRPPKS